VEKSTQSKLIKYLKEKGCYVIKTRPGGGTPVGCPDIIALFDGLWIAIEVKSGEKAPFQPLQLLTLEKLSKWGYTRTIYPENYADIIIELDKLLCSPRM
jgi:Holliday junction resolvase